MKSIIVVGLQWGDEGKGKIVDAIAPSYEYVVRMNGGNNAGHTVVVNGQKFPLSLVPSGVLQGKKLLIAQGVVINPKVLLDEIAMLQGRGITINLSIDPRCHIVMPYHMEMDAANEHWKGKLATGSLHLGIGYCYEDRNNRHGIRMEDLIRPDQFKKKLHMFFPLKLAIITKVYGFSSKLSLKNIEKDYLLYGRKLKKYISDVRSTVVSNIDSHTFLFELAHGTMLDPVFGTYPFTVAPYTISSSVFPNVGIPARKMNVLGVVKAYTSRVGNGPFPTEITAKVSETIRKTGGEFGTVSKRPRRIGWLDLPQLRYSVQLNGCNALALTKIDVLTGLKNLYICTHYKYKNTLLPLYPAESHLLPQCKPVYKKFDGWEGIGDKNMKTYISFIQKQLDVPISHVSTGAERKAFLWH